MHKLSIFFLLLLGVILVSSCDSKGVYDEYEAVAREWHKDSIVIFKLGELDSIKSYDLFINVRNNSDYKYSNLFLITEIQFPNGKVISDTLQYDMAAPNGEWLGTGSGDLKESKLWYKENVNFNEPGEYEVHIKQAMRKNGAIEGIEKLKGITHVGFRIEDHVN